MPRVGDWSFSSPQLTWIHNQKALRLELSPLMTAHQLIFRIQVLLNNDQWALWWQSSHWSATSKQHERLLVLNVRLWQWQWSWIEHEHWQHLEYFNAMNFWATFHCIVDLWSSKCPGLLINETQVWLIHTRMLFYNKPCQRSVVCCKIWDKLCLQSAFFLADRRLPQQSNGISTTAFQWKYFTPADPIITLARCCQWRWQDCC